MVLVTTVVTAQHQNQVNQLIWLNGRVMCANPISSVDSMTFANEVQMDTLHMLLPRTLISVVHDTVIKTDTIVRTNTVYVKDTVYINKCHDVDDGIGIFSVSADKQVSFAKGNLQYTQSTQTWSFAERQYDILGTDNVVGDSVSYDATEGYSKNNSELADKIDLFGWSGSTATAKWGVSASTDDADYSGDFVDWGTNIGDGSTWYTLTGEEWTYLSQQRENANDLFGMARININTDGTKFVNGIILLPDDWICPAGITFKSGFSKAEESVQAYADYQVFNLPDWQKMEYAGAVFFPMAGSRSPKVALVQTRSGYWSATPYRSDGAGYMIIHSEAFGMFPYSNRDLGLAVRLVRDVK